MAQPQLILQHSLSNNASTSTSNPIDSSLCKVFDYLSIGLTLEEILDTIDKLQQCSREDLHLLARYCHRQSISLSSSQCSSTSDISCRSLASGSSINAQEDDAVENALAECATLQSPEHLQLNQNPRTSARAHTNSTPVCFTCNVVLSCQSVLRRHYKAKCEPEVTRICPICEWTGERLMRHYANSHNDRCSTSRCSKRTERVCDECKLQLSGSFVILEAKKAWGCPYCFSCFHTRDLWTRHCYAHYYQSEIVALWSYSTMIWSLLQHPDLEIARRQHNWGGCDWSRITEKTRPGLRDALQRHQIPIDVRLHPEYIYLGGPETLVEYAYQYIMTGLPYSCHFTHNVHQSDRRDYAQVNVNSQLVVGLPSETAFQSSALNQLSHGSISPHEITAGLRADFRVTSNPVPLSCENENPDELTDFVQDFQTTDMYTQPATAHCESNFQPDSASMQPTFPLENENSTRNKQITAETFQPPAYWSFRLLRETLVQPAGQTSIPPHFNSDKQVEDSYSHSINEHPCRAQNGRAGTLQSLCQQAFATSSVSSYERVVPRLEAGKSAAVQRLDEWQTGPRPVTRSDFRPMSNVIEELIWPMSSTKHS